MLSLRMDEYFKSNDFNVNDISVEQSSMVPAALQLSWIALTAAFFSIVIVVLCILFFSSPKQKIDVENQVKICLIFFCRFIFLFIQSQSAVFIITEAEDSSSKTEDPLPSYSSLFYVGELLEAPPTYCDALKMMNQS